MKQPIIAALMCSVVLCVGSVGAQDFRSIDGSGNNETNDGWGAQGTMLMRMADVDYDDGEAEPAGPDRPSARMISNTLCHQTGTTINSAFASDMLWLWGQFLDHDISLSLTHSDEVEEMFFIEVPTGDEWFDPLSAGDVLLPMMRSIFDMDDGVRQQMNDITAFIDASNVYGSDDVRAAALRANDGTGKMATSDGDLLPFNEDGLPNAQGPGPASDYFLAGDIRANENAALSCLHTLFVREHNRLCDEIADGDADLTGDEIYDRARRIVGAQMQVITYQEFLPALLGDDPLPAYEGYDDTVDPSIANEFSTACYRFGHSMLSPELFRYSSTGAILGSGHVALKDAFFSPSRLIEEGGIEPLLRGVCSHPAQDIDCQIIGDVRNFLFGPPGAGGIDLASLNIQRGRDHGIAPYNDLRESLDLDRVEGFDDITSDEDLAQALEDVYGSVDDVDAWIGCLAEDHMDGALVGETCMTIFVDQFVRLRDGDRFWYANDFDEDQVDDLEATTLADIIARNTDIGNGSANPFQVPRFRRGDLNQDGDVGALVDALFVLEWMFLDMHDMTCLQAADFVDNGTVDMVDVISIIGYRFADGLPPEPPFTECGHDDSSDQLGCLNYEVCD